MFNFYYQRRLRIVTNLPVLGTPNLELLELELLSQ
jgi:hypothetical protein